MKLETGILFHDRYLFQEMKGRGSFGEVWLARDKRLDLQVAVKVYIALDTRGVEEFKAEYKTTFGLNHPNLLHAYHFDICEDRPYLVMPYCPDSAMSLIGCCDEATLWRFIRDVASGLAYLHEKDILHHDIKPDNVLRDMEGAFLITDFGISTKMRSTLRRNSTHQANAAPMAGSIPYMAPEMFAANPETVKATDIWALGATLYELASGELPFFGQGGVMQRQGATMTRPKLPFSKGFIDTVMECLAKEPWERPKAKELAERAQGAIDGYPYYGISYGEPDVYDTPANDTNEPEKEPENVGPLDEPTDVKQRPKTWLWILLALLLAGGGGVAWWLTHDNKPKTDSDYFAYCKDNPTEANYRSYIKKFPDGQFVELAQNWLRADSIAKANEAAEAEANAPVASPAPDGQASTTPSTNDKPKDKKDDKKGLQEQPRQPEQRGQTERQEQPEQPGMEQTLPARQTPGLSPADGGLSEGLQEAGLKPSGDRESGSTPGLKQSENPKDENEAYMRCLRDGATLETCLYYMDTYGDSNTRDQNHWNGVVQVFSRLYRKKARSCSTIEECQSFLDQHESIMKRSRMKGTQIDTECSKLVNDKKKDLEKEGAGAGDQQSSTRYQPGVNSRTLSINSNSNSNPNH